MKQKQTKIKYKKLKIVTGNLILEDNGPRTPGSTMDSADAYLQVISRHQDLVYYRKPIPTLPF